MTDQRHLDLRESGRGRDDTRPRPGKGDRENAKKRAVPNAHRGFEPGTAAGLVIGLIIGAIGLELAQSFSPGRQTTLPDMLASLVGLALGYATARMLAQTLPKWAALTRQILKR